MQTAKLFTNGGSRAVRLPKDCRFPNQDEVYIKKQGEVVMLFPKNKAWEVFIQSLDMFTDDFMSDGRNQPLEHQERL